MPPSEILFFNHEVKTRTFDKEIIKKWLLQIAGNHHKKIESIQIIFCSDEYLRLIGMQFLNHDYYTDIVTFHYEKEGEPIEGELYISIDRIKENAKNFRVKTEQEKRRVIAHGMIHLLGFDDEKPQERHEMTLLENEYLQDLERMLTKSST